MRIAKTRAIFNAAVDVFSVRGFEKATMDEIAAKAKVAKGTIYYHFKSKEDLFVFLVDEGTKLLGESVLSKLPDQASATEQLRVIIREQLAFFQEYRDFCIIILREAWGEDTRQREFRRMLVHYVRSIQTIVENGIANGEFVSSDPETAAWSIFGGISIRAIHHIFTGSGEELTGFSPAMEQLIISGLSRSGQAGEIQLPQSLVKDNRDRIGEV